MHNWFNNKKQKVNEVSNDFAFSLFHYWSVGKLAIHIKPVFDEKIDIETLKPISNLIRSLTHRLGDGGIQTTN